MERLRAGEDVVVTATQNRIEAVTPLDRTAGMYLYIMRYSNPLAFSQWERAQSVLEDYEDLGQRASVLQLRFNLALFGVSLFLVGLSVWAALRFADRQVKPAGRCGRCGARNRQRQLRDAGERAPGGRTRSGCSTAPSTV